MSYMHLLSACALPYAHHHIHQMFIIYWDFEQNTEKRSQGASTLVEKTNN